MARIPDWVKVLMMKGEKGDKGDDGVSPTLSETAIDNGYRVTITDAEGTSSFDLHNATSGDYSGLTNKPSINGVILSGDKTGEDLSISPSIKTATIRRLGTGDITVEAGTSAKLSFLYQGTEVEGKTVIGVVSIGLYPDPQTRGLSLTRWENNLTGAFVYIRNDRDNDLYVNDLSEIVLAYIDD